jgi:hypothetical protein
MEDVVGYTHYFKQTKVIKLTKEQKNLINEVREAHKDILGVNSFSPSLLHINGVEEEAHEDFYVELAKTSDFEFCKTARKPYDLPVCKLLLVLTLSPGFTFSSDGDYAEGEESWKEAKEWFEGKGYTYSMAREEQDEDETPHSEVNMGKSGTTRVFTNTEDGHNKVWRILQTSPGTWEAHWGKIGGTLQGPKKYTTEEVEKVIRQKLNKGYVEE